MTAVAIRQTAAFPPPPLPPLPPPSPPFLPHGRTLAAILVMLDIYCLCFLCAFHRASLFLHVSLSSSTHFSREDYSKVQFVSLLWPDYISEK